ncbi:MAG: tRNA pseudouridine(55) synthase TruB [Lachnospiraceae bacterium]|nr:tRNA pseudouridine(55) synthase TruB [Lachnospiraceae bacterium]
MYHGIINVYKEAGYTSHDVVAKLRGICKQKKIGHTGTLDPDAVGVLPVCLGSGTKVCDLLTDRKKEYIARFRLGCVTDTQDISGQILEENTVTVASGEVKQAITSFEGESMQVPPMYSALKINGKKLYELARQGKEVERPARPINIYRLEIMEEEHPEYTIRVVCSKGTYIRTLCHDIGQKLGCGAVMVSLKRTNVGEFDIKDAYKLSELQKLADEERLSEAVCPVDKLFEDLLEIIVKEDGFKALSNGNPLKETDICIKGNDKNRKPEDREQFRVYNHQHIFFGIYRYEAERRLLLPVKLFFME